MVGPASYQRLMSGSVFYCCGPRDPLGTKCDRTGRRTFLRKEEINMQIARARYCKAVTVMVSEGLFCPRSMQRVQVRTRCHALVYACLAHCCGVVAKHTYWCQWQSCRVVQKAPGACTCDAQHIVRRAAGRSENSASSGEGVVD